MAAKLALVTAKRMSRPGLVKPVVSDPLADGPRYQAEVIEQAVMALYDEMHDERDVKISGESSSSSSFVRPDVRATAGELVDWIEIRVTNAVSVDKQLAMQKAGMRVIEVDMRMLPRQRVSLEEVRSFVVDELTCKRWIAHPRLELSLAIKAARLPPPPASRDRTRSEPDQEWPPRYERVPARQWLGDGVDDKVVITPSRREATDDLKRLEQIRRKLGLPVDGAWPRYLDLDLPDNGGSLARPRVWLSQLFADWVHGRQQGNFQVSDLVASAATNFGVKPRFGHADLQRSIDRRVLPYWEKCGFVVVGQGGRVTLTGKAAGLGKSLSRRL
jgi:hypothetical protein